MKINQKKSRRQGHLSILNSSSKPSATLVVKMMFFFFEMGAKCPSLCIKIMHTALFIKPVFKVLSVLLHPTHGSIKVAANINQQNWEQAIKSLCNISNAPRVQPATLVEYSLNNRHQAIASSIQRLPLLHRKKV
jgi:hypothetical protein